MQIKIIRGRKGRIKIPRATNLKLKINQLIVGGLTQKSGRQCQMNKSKSISRSGVKSEQNVALPGHSKHGKPTLLQLLLIITRHQAALYQLNLPINLRNNCNLHCNKQPGQTCNGCCLLMQHHVQPTCHNLSSMGSGIKHASHAARSTMPATITKHIQVPSLMVVVMEE